MSELSAIQKRSVPRDIPEIVFIMHS